MLQEKPEMFCNLVEDVVYFSIGVLLLPAAFYRIISSLLAILHVFVDFKSIERVNQVPYRMLPVRWLLKFITQCTFLSTLMYSLQNLYYCWTDRGDTGNFSYIS